MRKMYGIPIALLLIITIQCHSFFGRLKTYLTRSNFVIHQKKWTNATKQQRTHSKLEAHFRYVQSKRESRNKEIFQKKETTKHCGKKAFYEHWAQKGLKRFFSGCWYKRVNDRLDDKYTDIFT